MNNFEILDEVYKMAKWVSRSLLGRFPSEEVTVTVSASKYLIGLTMTVTFSIERVFRNQMVWDFKELQERKAWDSTLTVDVYHQLKAIIAAIEEA